MRREEALSAPLDPEQLHEPWREHPTLRTYAGMLSLLTWRGLPQTLQRVISDVDGHGTDLSVVLFVADLLVLRDGGCLILLLPSEHRWPSDGSGGVCLALPGPNRLVLGTPLPIVSKHSPWELSFRKQVRALATGWNVVEGRGRIRLKVRPPGLSEQSVVLPFRWVETDVGDAYVRIRNIYKLMAGGLDLRTAALQADGNAPQVVRDWKGAVERFQQQKLNHGNTISVATWNKAYQPVLDMSVLLLNGPTPPGRPVDLIDRFVADWEPGSRMRQIRRW